MTDAKKQSDEPQARGAPDPSEIADAELDIVTGGLMSPGGVSATDTSVCLSKT